MPEQRDWLLLSLTSKCYQIHQFLVSETVRQQSQSIRLVTFHEIVSLLLEIVYQDETIVYTVRSDSKITEITPKITVINISVIITILCASD